MSLDLRELYQEVILDHNKRPRNRGALDEPSNTAEGHNPLCGDNVRLFVKVEHDRVSEVSFVGSGCAISTASASMMTEAVKGRTCAEIEDLFKRFQQMVTSAGSPVEFPDLGDLEVLAGVRDYPVRIKCATLPWHTLNAALRGEVQAVSTE